MRLFTSGALLITQKRAKDKLYAQPDEQCHGLEVASYRNLDNDVLGSYSVEEPAINPKLGWPKSATPLYRRTRQSVEFLSACTRCSLQRKKIEGGHDGGTSRGADPRLSAAAFHPLQEPQHFLRGGVVQALLRRRIVVRDFLSAGRWCIIVVELGAQGSLESTASSLARSEFRALL